MVLQLEDCIDCMKFLYPEYQCVFLFDHSSFHAKKRSDGLDAFVMRKIYTGKETMIRKSLITNDLLGPFHDTNNKDICVDNSYQCFTFQDDDNGPFFLKEDERQSKSMDCFTDIDVDK